MTLTVGDSLIVRQPSKIRSLAEGRGIISYIGVREMGYKGFEIGRALNMGAGGVSLALRRGKSILRERVGIKEEILRKLVK